MKKLILAGLILASNQMAVGANWVYLGSNSEQSVYLDVDSLRVNKFSNGGNYLSVWSKQDFKMAQKSAMGKAYYQTKALIYFDCKQRKQNVSDVIFYDRFNNLVDNGYNYVSFDSSYNWQNVAPETIGSAEMSMACAISNNIK